MSRNQYLVALSTAVFSAVFFIQPVHAITVNSQDCSVIDTTDGNTEDWGNISHMIYTTDPVVGTTHYLDSDTDQWTTIEPSNWRYSANLDQQANIQEMKMCNTDIMQLMLRTQEPMMNFHDNVNDNYISFYSSYGEWPNMTNFIMPADYHYWMVWKMQAADGSGSIIYLAANLEIDAGTELNGDDPDNQVPQLFLYQESDTTATFDAATFDAFEDTVLTLIEVSQNDSSSCNQETGEGCESPTVEKDNTAFEVSQNIAELFNYADFNYGDTINISAAMYNSDGFSTASGLGVFSVIDETATEEYTFSKRAVTNLHPVKNSAKANRIALTWDKLKTANSYQIKLINPNNDKVVDVVRGITDTRYQLTGLTADTSYRAIVRGVIRKNGKKTYSAWSSGYKWTTVSK